ncbi:hypothetical protein MBLNU230_g7237t1 [Neophaeotheca triangularis]
MMPLGPKSKAMRLAAIVYLVASVRAFDFLDPSSYIDSVEDSFGFEDPEGSTSITPTTLVTSFATPSLDLATSASSTASPTKDTKSAKLADHTTTTPPPTTQVSPIPSTTTITPTASPTWGPEARSYCQIRPRHDTNAIDIKGAHWQFGKFHKRHHHDLAHPDPEHHYGQGLRNALEKECTPVRWQMRVFGDVQLHDGWQWTLSAMSEVEEGHVAACVERAMEKAGAPAGKCGIGEA